MGDMRKYEYSSSLNSEDAHADCKSPEKVLLGGGVSNLTAPYSGMSVRESIAENGGHIMGLIISLIT